MNIQQLRDLEQAATPGPWGVNIAGSGSPEHGIGIQAISGAQPPIADLTPFPHHDANAQLIAAMRNALPHLLNIAEASEMLLYHGIHRAIDYDPKFAGLINLLRDALARFEQA